MESSAVADDLNEISVILNVAHRLLLGLRDDVDTDPAFAPIFDDLDAAHEQLDVVIDSVGRALDRVDQENDRPREQRPAIH
jgi:hypothetical protein